MTPADSPLLLLAGGSPSARRLLEAARDDVLDAGELDRFLQQNCNVAVIRMGDARKLYAELAEAVVVWTGFEAADPVLLQDWSADSVDAEVLSPLYELVYGAKSCLASSRGWLASLDDVHPLGACQRHDVKEMAR